MDTTYAQYRRTRSYAEAAISYAEQYLGESSVTWPVRHDVTRVSRGESATEVAGDVAAGLIEALDWDEADADLWVRDYALALDAAVVRVSEDDFLHEVQRLGGTMAGAADWLAEAHRVGLDADDTAESLAWTCVDDELSNLDHADPRATTLRASLEAARV